MSEDKEMSFLDHLEELRWHVIRALSVVFVLMIGTFAAGRWIFENIVFAPAKIDFITFRYLCKVGQMIHWEEQLCIESIPLKIQSRLMTGQFTMHLTASFVLGIILAFPYVFWEIWRFVKPGLYSKEQSVSRWAVTAVSFQFLLGICFGYFVMTPLATWFLSTYSISEMISNEFDITSYVSTVTMLVFGSGLLFQMPVVVYFLTRIGIVTPQGMKAYRKHAIVAILILGAIITPPDPLSQALISLPLYMLYEISIVISRRVLKKMEREEIKSATQA
ncbi:MAG: twin-arginine translocase subunit TatC [Cyclobacteriaceae bacterium]